MCQYKQLAVFVICEKLIVLDEVGFRTERSDDINRELERERVKKGLFIALLVGIASVSQAAWQTSGDVTIYTNRANWEAALSGQTIQNFETTSANLLQADEVTTAPTGDNDLLGDTLTFDKASTGFNRSFKLWASQANNLVFNDNEGDAIFRTDVLSVGDVGNDENDNFYFNILGGETVSAAGFDVFDNNFGDNESFRVRIGTTVLADFDTDSLIGGTGSTMFLGVISTTEFDELWFNESTDTDDMAVGNFALVPEPATAGMLILSGLLIAAYRRFFGK